ncbi:MAG: Gx transporter family protein [Spirochaetes bacterium]|nr:Gx transporter family protein [Spirochaetota bacterium]
MYKLKFNDKKDLIYYIIALSSIFGAIENILPKPLIFIKIGFSNIPFLLVFENLNLKDVFFLLVLKSIISAIFSGTILSPTFLLSIVGAIGIFFGIILIKLISLSLYFYQSILIKYIYLKKSNKNNIIIRENNFDLSVNILNYFSISGISIFFSFFSNFFQLLFYSLFFINDIYGFNLIFFITVLSIFTGYLTGYISNSLRKFIIFEIGDFA